MYGSLSLCFQMQVTEIFDMSEAMPAEEDQLPFNHNYYQDQPSLDQDQPSFDQNQTVFEEHQPNHVEQLEGRLTSQLTETKGK